jgi:hypothetical protein
VAAERGLDLGAGGGVESGLRMSTPESSAANSGCSDLAVSAMATS